MLALCQEGDELAQFYDSFGIEGVRDGICELNGIYYYVMQLTYQKGNGIVKKLMEVGSGEVVGVRGEFWNFIGVNKAKEWSRGLGN